MSKHRLQLVVLISAVLLICCPPVHAQTTKDLPELTSVERELKGGETHSYRVSLTAGQFLHIVVVQNGIDVIAAAFAPDGKQLTRCDSPNDRWGSESVVLVAPATGEYRVDVISPDSKAAAARYQLKVIALREATAVDKGHAAALTAFDEGNKLRRQRNAAGYRAAIEKYEQALPLFHAAGDTYREAMTWQSVGAAYYPLNEFRKALDCFNHAVELARSLGDQRFESGTETWIAGMLDILGDVVQALEHYQRAVQLSRGGGWPVAEASALSSIGKIYGDIGEWDKALSFYAQALPIFKEQNNPREQAIALNNVGIAYSLSGEHERALDYLQQSLDLLRAGTDKNAQAYTLLNIGRAYRRLRQYEKALTYLDEAQQLQQQTGSKAQRGETLDEIGAVYSDEDQNEKALDYHRQALESQHAAGNLRREAIALNHLGEVYNLLDQPEKALEQYHTALPTFRNLSDLSNAATSLEGIARAEKKRGRLDDARQHIDESLALRETVRARYGSLQMRASYRASVEKAYEFLIDLLMEQHARNPSHGYDAEALGAHERGRARSFVEQLNEAQTDIRRGVDAGLLAKERDLVRVLNAKAQREMQLRARQDANELATLQREISALEDEYQQVESAIRQTSPQYAALTQPQPLGLKEIQQQLDPDTLLLEYSLGNERSYLWVVGPDSLKSYVLPKQDEIRNLAQQAYESLVARSVSRSMETPAQRNARIAQADTQFQQSAAELSRMILAPAAGEFRNKRLVVVADGALQYVPFAALPSANRRPLILDHELVSLSSASAFAVQRQNLAHREPAPKTLAVIADPVFSVNDARMKKGVSETPSTPVATRIIEHGPATASGSQFSIPRLPFTRWEADQILAVARNGSNLKALDFRANRAIATGGELSKYRYVHFATHGYLDTTRAGLSAIVLSLYDEDGKPQDGFLRTHDLYNLKLPAELVVLSACETGLGKDVQGEGLEGLTRGFMYAGARRVIVSLWNVNDKATASLMQRLYAGMLRDGKTPAAALRAAQIELLRTAPWQSAYYWAPFVMQGEWK